MNSYKQNLNSDKFAKVMLDKCPDQQTNDDQLDDYDYPQAASLALLQKRLDLAVHQHYVRRGFVDFFFGLIQQLYLHLSFLTYHLLPVLYRLHQSSQLFQLIVLSYGCARKQLFSWFCACDLSSLFDKSLISSLSPSAPLNGLLLLGLYCQKLPYIFAG
eukprot:TRINITY_DN1975_c0_g3_i6.p2 TRINITY_DN1975_c0_g3~~TRINITY_DN1975_c0_g3_i6.p2  ORF type:complete len:179 (+),score=14.93 TRINITY_DN1975_c0_g3_i6:62-538(+)